MTLLSPTVELYVNAAWTDVTTYVRVADGVVINRGRQDEQGELQASTLTLTLDNRDGRFSPRNPTGAYYGTIGRNTPVRVSCGGAYRFYGEISAWPPRWDVSESNAWTTVQGAGITRRLTQGPKPLSGPITRYVGGASNVFAYWPCDDAQGATEVASGLSSGSPLALEGTSPVQLAADSTFPTTGPLPVLNNGALIGPPGANAAGDMWAYFLLSVPVAGDTDDTTLFRLLQTNGSARFEIRYFTASSGSLLLRGFDSTGASVLTSSSVTGLNGVPCVVALKLDQSGADVAYSLSAYIFSSGSLGTVSGTVSTYTLASLGSLQINADRAAVNISLGQIILTKTDQTTAVVDAMRGYNGEAAATRFERLCTEEGISAVTVGTAADSELMGPQTSMTLLDLLKQCEASDGGYLFEPKDSLALGYRTRSSMYAAAADLTLAYTNLSELAPVEDDQATRNDVTVNKINGSSGRYEVTTGPLSTDAPPTGVGRYNVSLDLSLSTDTRCLPQAEWRATLGTLDEPRYPVINVDLQLLSGATKTAAIALDVGDSMEITGPPGTWVPPSGIQALVLGYRETITPTNWWLATNNAQGSVWAAPLTLDDTNLGRLDSSSTTTSEALDTTETGVDYTGGTWITTATHPTEFPFDIVIGGEQMTVTAATASTFTVTRSVNGVVKSHSLGASVTLARPNRIML